MEFRVLRSILVSHTGQLDDRQSVFPDRDHGNVETFKVFFKGGFVLVVKIDDQLVVSDVSEGFHFFRVIVDDPQMNRFSRIQAVQSVNQCGSKATEAEDSDAELAHKGS